MSRYLSTFTRYLSFAFPLACGASGGDLYEPGEGAQPPDLLDDVAPASDDPAPAAVFPGSGTSGAAEPLTPGLSPDSASDCHPASSAAPVGGGDVQVVCFYTESEPAVPAATIEQVVEVVGTEELIHMRLILNPTFVDNSYGATAIGWSAADEPTASEPEPAAGDRMPRPRPRRPGAGAHSFRDLVGSDHAEIQLLDGSGAVALHFKLDYLSESTQAPSGYASLGVSGGEGKVLAGDASWILASSTSIDRNLNACLLGDFVEDSPATDASFSANDAAPEWDFRVIYEVWVSREAFGSAGFGSALIESVHASPSKTGENTETVTPAPCPPSPDAPDAPPAPIPPVLSEIR